MDKIRLIKTCILACALLLTATLLMQSVKADEKAITNEDIYRILGKFTLYKQPHSIMQRQHDRIHLMMTSFLMGDTETLDKTANEMNNDMGELIETHLPSNEHSSEDKSTIWKSIAEISHEVEEMHSHVKNKEYAEAYEHFTAVKTSCIRCHQAARSWGKFPEIKPLPTEIISPETTSTPTY